MSTDQVSDTTMEAPVEAAPVAKKKGKKIMVEIVKAKQSMEFWTGDLPDEVYMEALRQGLKVLANRGTTKITKSEYPNPDELKAAALAKATTIKADMEAGKIRIVGGGKDKVTGAVKTEAMRMGRALVKDELKRQKIKISYVDAKDITKMAEDIIRINPEIMEKAKQAVEAREAEAAKLKEGLAQIVTPGMINQTKKAKVDKAAAEEKAKANAALSSVQAGIAAQRPAKAKAQAKASA